MTNYCGCLQNCLLGDINLTSSLTGAVVGRGSVIGSEEVLTVPATNLSIYRHLVLTHRPQKNAVWTFSLQTTLCLNHSYWFLINRPQTFFQLSKSIFNMPNCSIQCLGCTFRSLINIQYTKKLTYCFRQENPKLHWCQKTSVAGSVLQAFNIWYVTTKWRNTKEKFVLTIYFTFIVSLLSLKRKSRLMRSPVSVCVSPPNNVWTNW
jgi:hypothetical protein